MLTKHLWRKKSRCKMSNTIYNRKKNIFFSFCCYNFRRKNYNANTVQCTLYVFQWMRKKMIFLILFGGCTRTQTILSCVIFHTPHHSSKRRKAHSFCCYHFAMFFFSFFRVLSCLVYSSFFQFRFPFVRFSPKNIPLQ